jgi:hypothetical protein
LGLVIERGRRYGRARAIDAVILGRGGVEMVGRSFAGVMLVAIGVALLLIELTGVGGVAIVLLGGLAFLATHLATRSYGFLVPGGILTGFGAALVAQDLGLVADVGLIGLGAGFLIIPTVQLLTGAERPSGWWWPLIPGGILVLLGILEKLDGRAAGLILPGLLIIMGLGFLLAAARSGPEDVPAQDHDASVAGPAPEPEPEPESGDPQPPGAR